MKLGNKVALIMLIQLVLLLAVVQYLAQSSEKSDIKSMPASSQLGKDIIQQSVEESGTQQTQTEIFSDLDGGISNYVSRDVVFYVVLVSIASNAVLLFVVVRILKKENEMKIRYERFSTIGEITAKISHDLRNPLTVVHSTIRLLQAKYGQDSEKEFQRAFKAIERMTEQINDVLTYVKTLKLEMKMSSLKQIITDALEDLVVPENIRIMIPDNDKTVYCDPTKIRTILINIIQNAIQAINSEQGTIKINLDENSDYVVCQIEDSGPGIENENLKKVFQPLFTTKPNGTGLGLYSSKIIMDKHNGKISVNNNPTTFAIYLPKNSGIAPQTS